MSPKETARHRAANEIRTVIRRYGTLTRTVLDDPLTGVRAALLASRVAFGQVREYAEEARGAGRSWDEIAAALDLSAPEPSEYGPAPGEIAFAWLIEGRDPAGDHGPHWSSRATARWTCAVCGARVTDRGPFESHPDDNESGHEPDCARRAAAVRTFQSERGDFR